MKRYFYFLLLCLFFVSCSKKDNNVENTQLESAYNKLKTGIIGTWRLDGYYRSRVDFPSQTFGWNENLDYWKNHEIYKLTFTNDGKFIDNLGNNSTYSIYYDENKSVYYNSDRGESYWPFKTGAIYLKLNGDSSPLFYEPYLAEIKNDGKLYLYDTQLGADGDPEYRFKKQ